MPRDRQDRFHFQFACYFFLDPFRRVLTRMDIHKNVSNLFLDEKKTRPSGLMDQLLHSQSSNLSLEVISVLTYSAFFFSSVNLD